MVGIDSPKIEDFLNEVCADLRVIREIAFLSRNDFLCDLKCRFAARYALVDAVGVSTLIGLRILGEKFDVQPETYEEVFDLLAEFGVISLDVCNGMNRLVDLRNVIVNVCVEVDDLKIYNEVKKRGLHVIEEFVEEIEKYISCSGVREH